MRLIAVPVLALLLLGAAGSVAQPAEIPPPPPSRPGSPPAAPGVTMIHAGTLLDRPGRPPRRNASILIRDGRIVSVEDGFAAAPEGARLIDLRDRFVLPGLIDSHVHLASDRAGNEGFMAGFTDSPALRAHEAAWNARKTLDAGFTTVRNLGDANGVTLGLRDAINRGWAIGPRILDAGGTISGTTGHADPTLGVREEFHGALLEGGGTCDGAEDCRRAVRRQVARGVDVIKIATTGGVNSRIGLGLGAQMFEDEVRALIDTAHLYGRRVAVHAHGADGINLALRLGADSIEHGTLLDDESIRLFRQHNAYYVPTLSTVNGYLERIRANPNAYPPEVREKIDWRIQVTGQSLRRAMPAGVRIAFGTDAGVSLHGRNADEFLLMVQHGMTPAQAIVAATVNAADLLGLADQVGSIEPGRVADIIAVSGDPLTDVGVLRRIDFVMARAECIVTRVERGSNCMTMTRRQLVLATAASGLVACTPRTGVGSASAGASNADAAARARTVYDGIFQRMQVIAPELATSLGTDVGERAVLRSRLGNGSYENRAGTAQAFIEARPQLMAIDRSRLRGRDRGWLDTARWVADRAVTTASFDYGGFARYPIPYVLSQLTGSYQSVPDFLDSTHPIQTRDDAEAYLTRLDQFGREIGLEVDRARADAGRGVVPPGYIVDKTLAQSRSLREDLGPRSGLVQSLVRRTRAANIAGDWQSRAARIVEGPLAAAVDRQIEALTELRGRAGTSPAAGRLPRGAEFYQHALRFHTSTPLTPEEAHAIGLQQVAQVSAEAEILLRGEGLTDGPVGARLRALGQQARHQYANTDAGRTELIADLNRHMEMVRARMPEVFATIPPARMEIRRVPIAIETGAPRGSARGGSLDGSRPGAFYINLVNTSIWPKWSLPTLNHHESIPGHLWQGATVLAQQEIPLLHRSIGIPAFGEGWGLYAEQLADEIGVYRENPLGRLGMLQSFLYRAARIVMDTGMHSRGWERERTIQYFIDTVGLDPISATSEVERYIVWPGQACSYKIGHNEMLRIRADARRRLGRRFDIKAFHDLVLLSGDMPLEVLATMAREWTGGRVV